MTYDLIKGPNNRKISDISGKAENSHKKQDLEVALTLLSRSRRGSRTPPPPPTDVGLFFHANSWPMEKPTSFCFHYWAQNQNIPSFYASETSYLWPAACPSILVKNKIYSLAIWPFPASARGRDQWIYRGSMTFCWPLITGSPHGPPAPRLTPLHAEASAVML